MRLIIVSMVIALSACGTSSQVRTSYAPAASDKFTYEIINTDGMSDAGLTTLKEKLDAALAARGQRAAGTEPDAKKLNIEITNYYMRNGAARILVGIMAGVDSVRSTVKITDASGTVLGQADVNTKNATAFRTSDGLIESHANEIVDFASGPAKK